MDTPWVAYSGPMTLVTNGADVVVEKEVTYILLQSQRLFNDSGDIYAPLIVFPQVPTCGGIPMLQFKF